MRSGLSAGPGDGHHGRLEDRERGRTAGGDFKRSRLASELHEELGRRETDENLAGVPRPEQLSAREHAEVLLQAQGPPSEVVGKATGNRDEQAAGARVGNGDRLERRRAHGLGSEVDALRTHAQKPWRRNGRRWRQKRGKTYEHCDASHGGLPVVLVETVVIVLP